MTPVRTLSRIGLVLLAGALTAIVVLVTGAFVEQRALDRLVVDARAAASLRQALLASEIGRFRLLPLTLSDDSDLRAALTGSEAARGALDRKLEGLAKGTGAAVIYALEPRGIAIAASNWRGPTSFVGTDYAFRGYYREALRSGAAAQFALGTVSRKPGLYLAQRSRGGGVLVVKLEFDRLEAEWARAGGITFAEDANGIILVTSRPDWRFTTTTPLAPAAIPRLRRDLQVGDDALRPLSPMWGLASARASAGDPVVVAGPGGRMLWTQLPAGDMGWRLNLLTPLDRAVEGSVRLARLIALLASLLAIGVLWGLWYRMRRRAGRVAAAAAHTAELEAMVAVRTADLRREIGERAASEARADTLREGLRQANRLASLGQITAGLAHETAQPVAAIRSYAQNALVLLERGDDATVATNLAAIGRLADRIGTITAELRGFSRKATGAIVPLPLAEALDGAKLILRARLARVAVDWPVVAADVAVLADRVRLEQVLVNLLQNALEALDGRANPRITLTVEPDDALVRMRIADNGPGIDPAVAARLFTPFVTSRPNGLGLGLVIASDIMADLGGALRLVPLIGGACFELDLRRAPPC